MDVYPGLNAFAPAFGEVTKGGVEQNFQKIFIDDDKVATGGPYYGIGDEIQVYDSASGMYDIYYVFVNGSSPRNYTWYYFDDEEIEAPITVKQGFWYDSKNASIVEMTVAGEVNLAATTKVNIKTGLNLIGFTYPTEFDVNKDVKWKNSDAIGGPYYGIGDEIQVYNSATGMYDIYYMFINGSSARNYTWYYFDDEEIEFPIPAVKGFWYDHKGTGFELEFVRPFNVDDVE